MSGSGNSYLGRSNPTLGTVWEDLKWLLWIRPFPKLSYIQCFYGKYTFIMYLPCAGVVSQVWSKLEVEHLPWNIPYELSSGGNISDLYLLQWEIGRFAKRLFVALETKSLTYGISMTACNMSVTSGSLGCTSLQLCVVGNYNIICEPIKLCTW